MWHYFLQHYSDSYLSTSFIILKGLTVSDTSKWILQLQIFHFPILQTIAIYLISKSWHLLALFYFLKKVVYIYCFTSRTFEYLQFWHCRNLDCNLRLQKKGKAKDGLKKKKIFTREKFILHSILQAVLGWENLFKKKQNSKYLETPNGVTFKTHKHICWFVLLRLDSLSQLKF